MDLISILLISIALSMDAFSIGIADGFSIKNIKKMQSIWFGIFFAGFHVLMPVLGYISGSQFEYLIREIAPFLAFTILSIIGFKMIYDSLKSDNEKERNRDKFSLKETAIIAFGCSLDAFAIGITFAITRTHILIPLISIGVAVFLFSQIGIYIGKKVGPLFEGELAIVAGLVLIALGVKVLLMV